MGGGSKVTVEIIFYCYIIYSDHVMRRVAAQARLWGISLLMSEIVIHAQTVMNVNVITPWLRSVINLRKAAGLLVKV